MRNRVQKVLDRVMYYGATIPTLLLGLRILGVIQWPWWTLVLGMLIGAVYTVMVFAWTFSNSECSGAAVSFWKYWATDPRREKR